MRYTNVQTVHYIVHVHSRNNTLSGEVVPIFFISLNDFPFRVVDTSIRAAHNVGLSCRLRSGKQAR